MANKNYVYIYLDTTPPLNPRVLIEGGAQYISSQIANLTLNVDDPDTTGYQMKIWGDVDPTYDPNVQPTEEQSSWITYNTNTQVKLSDGDNNKSIYIRVRDDVHNPSVVAIASVILDTSIPVVTVTGLDISKISLQPGKDTATMSFQVSEKFVEYKVKLVGSINATHDTGTLIGTTHGSINTSGIGEFEPTSITTVTLKAKDLEVAGARMTDEEPNIIKVFVKDESGLWSV